MQHSHSIRARISDDPVLSFDNTSNDLRLEIDLATIDEAAALLKVSVSTLRRLQNARRLPFIKVRGSVRFPKRDLASYLATHRVEALDT